MKTRKRWTLVALGTLLVGLIALLPLLASADTVRSQRSWMREKGQTGAEGKGRWVWRGTGETPVLGTKGWPIRSDGTEADPAVPATCVGCHSWVEGKTITESGFMNVLGKAPGVVDQDISPKALLDAAIHVDPATGAKTYDNKHAENYDKQGCAACHTVHGRADNFGCGKCHIADQGGFTSPAHTTHAALVNAEEPVFDPAAVQAGSPSCHYCHRGLADPEPQVGGAACWNCHLSGHRPKPAAYWGLGE
ncbi:MAG: hypothetical protein WDA27_02490 [Actinomycetota bacterium]